MRSWTRLWVSSRTFSAPQTTNFRSDSSPGSAARAYWFTKVSVASRIEALESLIRGGICLVWSGEGYWKAFIPVRIGSSTPPVRPKQWKIGSGLNITQSGSRSIWVAICRTLATRLACDRTTPRGAPKLPEVKRMTPGSDGLLAARNCLGRKPPAAANSLSAVPTCSRTSSR